jgi:molybdopterin/thiamine biosynthesis adenylyltransferase
MMRFDRQSFLGPDSEKLLADLNVGIVGLGGGGSHVAQQLAHIGIGRFTIADPDHLEDTNLNRLVGATFDDVVERTSKADVAERLIRNLNPGAEVISIRDAWQSAMLPLRSVDILIGAVDTYKERNELERFARRFLIPYVDLGMDVHMLSAGVYAIGGQIVLSMPGHLCLWCMGILNEERLAEEARRYGDVGGRPQVIWPNGILASTAVGVVMQLVAPWYPRPIASAYLEYDGNNHTVQSSNRLLPLAGVKCPHYPADAVGDPFVD